MRHGVTDPELIAQQADMVAVAWSPPEAPPSWRLTAAQFAVLRDEPELLAIAAAIPSEKLPPLLFQAAASFLVAKLQPQPLRESFPRVGEPQTRLGEEFGAQYRTFCLDQRDRLMELCASHRYQMNEVGRCAHIVPALAARVPPQGTVALVDVGTGAGLALHLDRYRYLYRLPGGDTLSVGPAEADVVIETEARGPVAPPVPSTLPAVAGRFGIDVEPLDLADPEVRSWLAACVPQEVGALTRFERAAEVALAHPADLIRGDAATVLPELLARIPEGPLVCLMDTYVHVFFSAEQLRRFGDVVDAAGTTRDLDWVSIDPLVPMGPRATGSVLGLPVPPGVLQRNRDGGVFGVVGRLGYRDGRSAGTLLGLAHPGAAWLEWLVPTGAG